MYAGGFNQPGAWETLGKKLKDGGFDLVAVDDNLIDIIWEGKPLPPSNLIIAQPLKWTGESSYRTVASSSLYWSQLIT